MPPIKIAVIGSGIAGLAAAHRLGQQADTRVTLFEKHDRVGMDAHRLELTLPDQVRWADVPSRMFNALQWPNLVKLYDKLGVVYQSVDATQSFSHFSHDFRASRETFLKLEVAFRPGESLRQMLRPRSRRLLSEATRLMQDGRRDLETGIDSSQTLGQYLQQQGYSNSFRDQFLYPTLSSTVCTCSFAGLDDYPATIVLSALRRLTDDRDLMRTCGGTQDVVTRLASPSIEMRTNYTAAAIVANPQQVAVTSDQGDVEEFDHVIMATQANTAVRLLPGIGTNEIEMLNSIPYEDVHIVVHRDADLMPRTKSDWCTFNMGTCDAVGRSAMCTVWLNRFHDWSDGPDHFQTIMPVVQPDPSAVLAEVRMQRPAVNVQSTRALERLAQLHQQPDRRIWFCGSWSSEGVPLLETGVVSAERVVEAILATRHQVG